MEEFKFKQHITPSHSGLLSKYFHARDQAHIWHLQAEEYSSHLALNEFYNKISDSIDNVAEIIQGKTCEIIKGYCSMEFKDFVSIEQIIYYLKVLKNDTLSYMSSLDSSWCNIDNQLQSIVDLIETTIYKLKFLK